ncbi:MAG: beta-lactamase family protein [Cyclobacteriaceae bacterium]|nr:beta-lactamase family protein [Cyclobacteriaceae bacterium]
MKKVFYSLIILMFGCSDKELLQPNNLAEYINQTVQPYLFTANTPGIGIGVFQNNEISYYFFGVRNLDSGQPFDENTLIEIGSITKTFTSTLLAKSHLNGSTSLNQPIYDYLPSGVNMNIYATDSIRFVHLANHTSGMPRQPDNDTDKFSDYGLPELFSFLNNWNPSVKPGVMHEYSNVGVGLLGYLLERVENTSYETLVQQQIFNPLGMTRSYVNTNVEQDGNFATGYIGINKQEPFKMTQANQAAGSIISTPSDMMKYLIANIQKTHPDLGQVFELAQTFTFEEDEQNGFGLSWFITKVEEGYTATWHNGGTDGFNSFIGFDENRQQGVFVVMNSRNSTALPATELGALILSKMRSIE